MRKPCPANSERSSHAPSSPSHPARGMARWNRATVCISSVCRKPNQPNAANLAKSKAQVLDLWRDQERREENEKYFAALLKKYVVVVDEDLKPLVGPLDSSIAGPVGGSPEEGFKMKATLLDSPRRPPARRGDCRRSWRWPPCLFPVPALAHELRPAYLELREEKPGVVQRVVENADAWRRPTGARTGILRRRKAITPVTTRTPPARRSSNGRCSRPTLRGQTPANPRAGKHHDGHTRTDGVRRRHGVDAAADRERTIGEDPDPPKSAGRSRRSISDSASSISCWGSIICSSCSRCF